MEYAFIGLETQLKTHHLNAYMQAHTNTNHCTYLSHDPIIAKIFSA